MLIPLFLFAAFASAQPAPVAKLRVVIIAASAAHGDSPDDDLSSKPQQDAEADVVRIVANELSLGEVKASTPRLTGAQLCASDATDYVLTVHAEIGTQLGPTPGIVPVGNGRIRFVANGTAGVSGTLQRCPGTTVAQSFAAGSLDRVVNPSMSTLFHTLAEKTAYDIVSHARKQESAVAQVPIDRARVSVIAHNAGKKSTSENLAVAEERVVQKIERGRGLKEVTTVASDSVTHLCANGATDYVLSIEAAIASNYTLSGPTPSTPVQPANFVVASRAAPQISVSLLRCPGILIATAMQHAWSTPVIATPPTFAPRFTEIVEETADEILAQIPANHS